MIVVGVGGVVVDSAVFDSAVVDVGGAWHTASWGCQWWCTYC